MKLKAKMLRDIALEMLDPIVAKKTGLNLDVFAHWEHIVGVEIAQLCYPLKLSWRARTKPASLLLAASSVQAALVVHCNLEIIDKINSYFGYYAVDQIKITQMVNVKAKKATTTKITANLQPEITKKIEQLASVVKDEKLRLTLSGLGYAIFKHRES